ncbi:hypothetical protein Taro_025448 [Colocasia esculenta]|uniref:Uncharacterized protein n=1 Tax=Colocasia esculenta TaxID=4460 RepID=A0A843V9F4_COLES|nr:hypothetical protein [Colocasia esculenta]
MWDYHLFHSPNQARSLQDVFMKVVHDILLSDLQLESHQTGHPSEDPRVALVLWLAGGQEEGPNHHTPALQRTRQRRAMRQHRRALYERRDNSPSRWGHPSRSQFNILLRVFGVHIHRDYSSVDTPIDGVDTGSESLKLFHEDRVKCVDTTPGSVDTRPRFQKTQLPDYDSVSTQPVAKTQLPDWDSVSTQPVAVSTLVSAPRRPVLHKWDSVSTHSLVVSTHSG